ncbi:receptor-like protein kinase HSL1 [Impatiens glandulifera]|uniref:receptor-like protein kinase HSL1 n=1 Tax=Impatiens glandulifera TaxID=253017 RepID=UPI001FB14BDC|nr:receptor-like protein kinase HSL1 [Impatiens glandulifera]
MSSSSVYLFFLLFMGSWSWSSLSLNQEGLYLQEAKLAFSDPNGALSDWDSRGGGGDAFPCNWSGVTCDSSTFSVKSIFLPSAGLAGPFPSILCRLPSLSSLSLADNSINSTLPPTISLCRNLLYLNLSLNLFTGPIPDTLPDIPNLTNLYLNENSFSGPIPSTFGRFSRLQELSLKNNFLHGPIPSTLANLTTLKRLELSYNTLISGPLPPELGNLTNLEYFWASYSSISGPIPPSFGRLNRLTNMDLSNNLLTGPIPADIFQLNNLVQLELYNNSLSGELPPVGWSNMTALRRIDLSSNALTGRIPEDLCALPLQSLNLYNCRFVGRLPPIIARSPNLYELKLYNNNLHGWLPRQLGRNSPLNILDVSENHFSGELPPGLCDKGVLEQLCVIYNSFSGSIPDSLKNCRTLARIRLAGNKLSGELPVEFWGLPNVNLLDIADNLFSGNISDMISRALNLKSIKISKNQFSGRIPRGIGSLNKLIVFEANDNLFIGSIPDEFTELSKLVRLDLSNNNLSGKILVGIQELKQLNELKLSNNSLSDQIPKEIGSLPALDYLDLSSNLFWGEIPPELQNLQLNILNLSYNDLSGDIPPLYSGGAYKDSFLGNPKLSIHHVKAKLKSSLGYFWFLRLIFIVFSVVISFGIICFFWKIWNLRNARKDTSVLKWNLYHKLDFCEDEILECLKDDNIIGSGGSSTVYKATLRNDKVVAVKKLLVESKSEDGGLNIEEEVLGMIRHKNIIKMWCSCNNWVGGGDYKLLVFEYMKNGSVGDMLYGIKKQCLDWGIRYRIALDAAEGLSYLHHDCVPPIVHRDVKLNNILVDEEFRAKLADFGVAKAVKMEPKSMSVVAGSCGYIAPEYAYTLRVNEKSDTYSFGVVILELVTGKRPTDPELGEKDLTTWVRSTLNEKGIDYVVDPPLFGCTALKAQICSVLGIGLQCTSHIPMNRPSMRRVVNLLQEAGVEEKMDTTWRKKDEKLAPTPSCLDETMF